MMRYFLVFIPLFLISCGGDGPAKGDRLFNEEKYDQAIEQYSEVLESNPGDINALYNRGRSYEELGKFDLAENDFLTLLEMDEKNISAFLSLSKISYKKEAYNKAVLFADRALALNESSAQGHFLLARAKHQLGYVDSALESYSLAINIDRDYGEAYLYRGALKIHKKQSRSACEDFRKAVNLEVPEAKAILKKYCR